MVLLEPFEPFPPLDRESIREDLAAMRVYLQKAEVFRNQTQLLILMRIPTENNVSEVPALDILTINMIDTIWNKHNGFWATIRTGTFPEAILVRRTLAAVHEFYNNVVDHYPNYDTRMIEQIGR